MAYWIIVVDDDTANLQMAGHILSRNNMRVTALKSGRALLDYISSKGQPDLILLDINMPGMDGFETLEKLRDWESSGGREETPVIFLTADEGTDTETHGFEAGGSDYIKKPFNPDILLRRINNIISKQNRIKSLRTEATTDKLTGFLNKSAAKAEIGKQCSSETGCLMMIDLDSFKLVNDIYGHEMGDRVLISFAKIISEAVPEGSKCARIGGDEFVSFGKGFRTEEEVAALAARLNADMIADAKQLMGEDFAIPLGASVGGVMVPDQGTDYEVLLKLADKALYNVKQNGKHGSRVYNPEDFQEEQTEINSVEADLMTLSTIIGERNIPNSALWLDKEIFSSVYRYIMRYIVRNQRKACKVLFTLSGSEDINGEMMEELCSEFGEHIKNCLRKSDILMRNKHNQYFVLLADVHEASVGTVVGNILTSWKHEHGSDLTADYVTEFVGGRSRESTREPKIVIADSGDGTESITNLLEGAGFSTVLTDSEAALLRHIEGHIPDLILLGPGAGGCEALKKLKALGGEAADVPVIIALDAEDSAGKALSLGAADIMSKPLDGNILLLRVRHILELVSLRRTLSLEVEKRTRESRDLFLHIVRSFADIIDSKDCDTGGHSLRVAEYSKEIARRAGLSRQQQEDIYVAALLHDVGKLGIPDNVIGKPSRLSEDERELVKKHSEMGAQALEGIGEMPYLAESARWHHERFGGGGYPDGLSGDNIPDGARIIAVADAYAAMTSRRRYRGILPQEQVRAEIEKGKGTQFDPYYADIMLEMIDGDKDYSMREE
ncbi:diguanylate cyclase (GGDEF) domain-containing protein/HDIG domain-containing protein [Ruminococcaceae bacterium FB2012]|nr:diguanylate cyclase (GGDEF) domain-containing protein/HDIG domain-containing protein [Ruminococcaceae bacterium FB2012]